MALSFDVSWIWLPKRWRWAGDLFDLTSYRSSLDLSRSCTVDVYHTTLCCVILCDLVWLSHAMLIRESTKSLLLLPH